MEPKRRLPLVSGGASAAAEPDRPPWQWIGFGALAIFVVWLPLSWGATVLVLRLGGLDGSPVARAGVFALGLAAAATAGGYLVGRWGAPAVGVRHAALAGLTAALVATMGAWGAAGVSLGALATVVVAVPPATVGGWLGRRRRARGP